MSSRILEYVKLPFVNVVVFLINVHDFFFDVHDSFSDLDENLEQTSNSALQSAEVR